MSAFRNTTENKLPNIRGNIRPDDFDDMTPVVPMSGSLLLEDGTSLLLLEDGVSELLLE